MTPSANGPDLPAVVIDGTTLDRAAAVSVGDLLGGSLSSADDVDYFRVSVDGPGRLVIGIEDENLTVRVFAPDGTEIPTRSGSTVADITEELYEKISDTRLGQVIVTVYHNGKEKLEAVPYIYGRGKEEAVNFYRDIRGITEAEQLTALTRANDRVDRASAAIGNKSREEVNIGDLTRLRTALDALDEALDEADRVPSETKGDFRDNHDRTRRQYMNDSREFELGNLRTAANALELALIRAAGGAAFLDAADRVLEELGDALDTADYITQSERATYGQIYENGRDTIRNLRDTADQPDRPEEPDVPEGEGLRVSASGQFSVDGKTLEVTHFESSDLVGSNGDFRLEIICPGVPGRNLQCHLDRLAFFPTELLEELLEVSLENLTPEERIEAIEDALSDDDLDESVRSLLRLSFGSDVGAGFDSARDNYAENRGTIRQSDPLYGIRTFWNGGSDPTFSYGGYGQWMVFDVSSTEQMDVVVDGVLVPATEPALMEANAFGHLVVNPGGDVRPERSQGSAFWRGAMVGSESGRRVHGKSTIEYHFSGHTVDVDLSEIVRAGNGAPADEPGHSWDGVPVNRDGSFYIPGHGNHNHDQTLHSTGYIDGDFYGPQGQEAAGVFETPGGMVGAFGAVRGE